MSKGLLAAIIVMTLCCAVCAERASSTYAVAAEHYRAGRWSEAVNELAQVVEEEGGSALGVDATFYLGEAYTQLGQ